MSATLTAMKLSNAYATLEPVEERHRTSLAVAGAHPAIWTLQPFNIAEGFDAYFDWLLGERAAGRWMPFVVFNPEGVVVGQSCYLDIRLEDDGIEIGGTWYSPIAQGTTINPAAKLLLLDHAFASGLVRVQFKTDERNARSRAAISKLGASFEGTFRKHKRRPDGSWRNTVFYSITEDDWPAARERLIGRLE
ncbi:GNAT family N-acetyltransferase [Sphingomonas sp.]|uniref:GNAT family N-acetyltransferase n=1 Tax=Sphingomonas sp. TaxID=28214 RepID=UPI003D6CE304